MSASPNEARNAARLTHANVVLVLDVGEHEGQPYLVMECLPGHSLHDEMKDGPMTEKQVRQHRARRARWARRRARTRHPASRHHAVEHPADRRRPRQDRRLRHRQEHRRRSTRPWSAKCSARPRISPPERLRGDAATTAADIYAVGVVLYEALTGGRAFVGDTPVGTAHAVVSTTPTPLSELRPGCRRQPGRGDRGRDG